ncbi:polyamine aminopropyltransferase [Hydrogenibacillus schlegelii]|nr:polyamine aminopropyltransferase [Hydrogenibacillus schlegelii]
MRRKKGDEMNRLPKHLTRLGGELWLTDDEPGLLTSVRITDVLFEAQSPFQHVMIADTVPFGRALILDGIIQTTVAEGFIYNEMIAHVPLSVHPRAERVLIIGGGDLGAAREVLKYPFVRSVDLVEIDQTVVEASRRYLPEIAGEALDPRLRLHFEDGARFAARADGPYDVIIVDAADPIGPATVLFESPFYEALARLLAEDGLLVAQTDSPFHHPETARRTLRALEALFPIVRPYLAVVPSYPSGLWLFTLASRRYEAVRPLDPGIRTRYATTDVMRAAFALPPYVVERIRPEGPSG